MKIEDVRNDDSVTVQYVFKVTTANGRITHDQREVIYEAMKHAFQVVALQADLALPGATTILAQLYSAEHGTVKLEFNDEPQ